ncbi:cold-shock protein [Chitinophaga vietnamensis]|uniref:cold-shock protein n=1 Tax=Chitinophaga vietnamensis TaxID=2593957 RepID=UPI001177A894|nr:cold shock domain-containing protein [Chitinophaga vietnamensis]
MGKQETSSNKKEHEKKKQQRKQEKEERRNERQASKNKGKSLEDMMAYIDEFGNITSTPPDPSKRAEIKAEDIQIGVSRRQDEPEELIRTGIVTFFNESKGFGFIKDLKTQESIFVHVRGLIDRVKENSKVVFEVEMGPKGPNAVNVKLA